MSITGTNAASATYARQCPLPNRECGSHNEGGEHDAKYDFRYMPVQGGISGGGCVDEFVERLNKQAV